MSQEVLIAEDDPRVAALLSEYVGRLGFITRATSNAQEARRWLEEAGGSVIVDGSVFGDMGIPLGKLPKTRVIVWSGDPGLVHEARQLGVRAFCKGNLQDFEGLLRELAQRD